MIQIDNLHHRIGNTPILSDINTVLPKGKLTALIGPNGAGKSTLIKLIGRLEPLQSGIIRIDDANLRETPTEALALKMAILGQQNHIASRLRLRELVAFGRWPHHRGRQTDIDHQMVDTALDALDLTPLSDRFLDELSGGQAQRGFVAMTYAQDTDWLLLDEPLNNLDMAHARGLMARLSWLVAQRRRSVVTVLHDVNYAAAWADHVVALKNGRIWAEGKPGEVLAADILSGLYETPIEVTHHKGRPLVLHHLPGDQTG